MRPSFAKSLPSKTEGAGKTGCALHPRSRVQYVHKNTHTSIQVQRRASGLPCAMVLRLITRSPRRRIPLVTVARGSRLVQARLGRLNLRKLDISNGCQDHTISPYAATRLRQQAQPGFGAVRPRADRSLTGDPPCDCRFAPTLPRPPHLNPRFVTIATRPSVG
jgi:hypothetical protein